MPSNVSQAALHFPVEHRWAACRRGDGEMDSPSEDVDGGDVEGEVDSKGSLGGDGDGGISW